MMLVTTADVTGGDMTIVVATCSLAFLFNQTRERATFVEVRVDHLDHATTAGRGRF
jgi:hypothetical protein